MNSIKSQDTKLIHRNILYSYTLTTKDQREKKISQGFFKSMTDLQNHVSSWYTTQWFSVSIHHKMINHVSSPYVINTKLLHYWLYFPVCTFYQHIYLLILSLYLLISITCFAQWLYPSSDNHLFVLCVDDCFCFMFLHLCVFRFYKTVKSGFCFSLTYYT